MIKNFDMFEAKKIKVLYSAVVLDEKSKSKLLEKFDKDVPDGWKKFAHHMTIIFNNGLDSLGLENDLGKEVNLTVTHLGKSDMAIAIKVEGYKTVNKTPHITLAINVLEGGKPQMSNEITDWQEVEPMILTGTVTEIKR